MSIQNLIVTSEQAGQRLDVFLTNQLSDAPSRTYIKKLIDSGAILLNGKQSKAHAKIAEDDQIDVTMSELSRPPIEIKAENVPLDVFYEDFFLAVINKPSGMIVHPATGHYSKTLVNALLHHFKNLSSVNADFRPGIVHRLDQGTSGLILIAKDNITHTKLAKQFEKHKIFKRYVALVEGQVEFDEGLIDAPLGKHPQHREKRSVQFHDEAREAETVYKVIQRGVKVSLVALYPKTGRTHQLRVHMAHLSHPILGDDKYGKKHLFPRLALHAQTIGFYHPESKKYMECSSVVPKEFHDACK